jgi:glycosyltransferase involved in cell wall biosynthesis
MIVLDGPNEETVSTIYNAAKRLTVPYQIINRKENKGFSYALNEGFDQLMDCQYFTWVSSDDRFLPYYLERLLFAIENAPRQTVLVYSLYFHINEEGERYVRNDSYFQFMRTFMQRKKEEIMQVNFIGVSHLFKREAFMKAGAYDPSYGVVADHEFWMRLIRTGDIRLIDEFLFEYRLNGKFSNTTNTTAELLIMSSMKASLDLRRRFGDIPKVTVLLTAHNQERFIVRAVESVLNQTWKDFHLVIIDDGSTDLTYPVIYPIKDSRIMPLHLANRNGKASALNIGLQYALGEYVLELDGDDFLDPQALAIMVREMDKQPDAVAVAYSNRKVWYQQGEQITEGPVVKEKQLNSKYEVLTRLRMPTPRFYRRSALESIGGWPISLDNKAPCIAEDLLVMLNLAEHYRFHWIDATLYHHRQHDLNLTAIHKVLHQEQCKDIITTMLSRWNSTYIPEFITENGILTRVNLL